VAVTEWEPATEAEAAMRDALRANDQELYFRILAQMELLLPVSAHAQAGQAPLGWGTWTTGGRTHVLAFTSGATLQVCLGDNAASTRRMPYHELASTWPNLEWWLAVNPGLPIEGYLPAWFVSQLARGDVRLPGRGMGAQARVERAETVARARATAAVPNPTRPGPLAARPAPGPAAPFLPPAQAGASAYGETAPPRAAAAAAENGSSAYVPTGPARAWDGGSSHGNGGPRPEALPRIVDAVAEPRDAAVGAQSTDTEAPSSAWYAAARRPGTRPGVPRPAPSTPMEAAPAAPVAQVANDGPVSRDGPRWSDLPVSANGPLSDDRPVSGDAPLFGEAPSPSAATTTGAPPTPLVPDFTPTNDVEKSLLAAAGDGSTDTFLSTLLLAKVLLPVSALSANGARPGEDGFDWRTERIDGERYVVVFTSRERLVDHITQPIETVSVKFVQLIRQWPDKDWSFAVNPGTPVGAKLPGAQILALANWATEVGLGDDAGASEPAEPSATEEPAPRSTYAPVQEDPTRPPMMQKAIAPSQVSYYLDRGYDRVSGFVHRVNELAHLKTPAQLCAALGLGYPNSPFSRNADEIYVLRWPAYRPNLYRIPYGGQTEAAMRAMQGWVIERPPFRGNGFAPGESSDVVAEFKVDSARLPHGAQLWRIGADGTERIVATLDSDAPAWRRVGEA
jgi:hypothetical protein